MGVRRLVFRIGMVIYMIGLLELLARARYGFHFWLINLFVSTSQLATYCINSGAILVAVVGFMTLAVGRRKARQRVLRGWMFMGAAAIIVAILTHR